MSKVRMRVRIEEQRGKLVLYLTMILPSKQTVLATLVTVAIAIVVLASVAGLIDWEVTGKIIQCLLAG